MCLIDPNNIHNPSQKEEMSGGFQIANMEALRAALMEVDKDVTYDTPFHMLIKSAVKAINEYADLLAQVEALKNEPSMDKLPSIESISKN